MCGIYGHYKPKGADLALIERMAVCLDHRGPDGYGTYQDGPLAFGAGRLAIIDLAAGVQPIFNEDRTIAVIFNGEIYNYKLLRAELEAAGHVFRTHTDTEVIVHGYEAWGADVLAHLRGMFAICVWDQPRQRLLLARDRIGEKPLYYATVGDNFIFASEIKALFQFAGLPRAVNHDVLPYFLTLGYTPAPDTMFKGIRKLAPGELLLLDRGQMTVQRYWHANMAADTSVSFEDNVRRVRAALTEAVELRLMSDVPLGAFLSGGVDSTAIVALMGRAMGRPVKTFTVGFDLDHDKKADARFNVDARYAALAANRLKTDHHAITVRPGPELAGLLPHLIYGMDEPVTEPAIVQTAYVAALARTNNVPVLLSGDASDELFAGYNAYRADRLLERYLGIPSLIRNSLLTPLLEHAPHQFESARTLARKSRITDPVDRYLTWMSLIPAGKVTSILKGEPGDYIHRVLLPLLQQPQTRYFADRIAFASLNLWIPEESNMRVDKMSMAMSTETRAPFEDHKLVELALQIPLEHKLRGLDFKSVLKAAVADLVPAEILSRPKWGFFPPASGWLRNVFRPLVDTYLTRERVAAAGCFDPDCVTRLVKAHMDGQYELWPVWSLLIFQIWHALYIDGSLTLDHKIRPADLIPDSVYSGK